MKGLREKFRNRKGFTLVEMLIVVAIIAILVAVSMPLVDSALEKARLATDAANERAFKGVLAASYLLDTAGMKEADTLDVEANTVYSYDSIDGAVVARDKVTRGYGQSKDLKGLVLYGVVNTKGEVKMGWGAKDAGPGPDLNGLKSCVSSTIISSN